MQKNDFTTERRWLPTNLLKHVSPHRVRGARVGRTPWSAADPPVGLLVMAEKPARGLAADQGVRPISRAA